MLETSVGDSSNPHEVLRSIHMGLLSVQRNPADRRSMAAAVLMLSGESGLPEPEKPGFYSERDLDDNKVDPCANKLHLNPVHAVVQIRPSLDHLNSSGSKRKNSVNGDGDAEVTVKLEDSGQEKPMGPSKMQNKRMESSTEKKTEDEESWFPLRYHSAESDFSARYLRKMVVQESSPIEFTMSPHDYVDSLCPKTCKGSSRRSLLSVPLEERIKKLIVEEPVARRVQ